MVQASPLVQAVEEESEHRPPQFDVEHARTAQSPEAEKVREVASANAEARQRLDAHGSDPVCVCSPAAIVKRRRPCGIRARRLFLLMMILLLLVALMTRLVVA